MLTLFAKFSVYSIYNGLILTRSYFPLSTSIISLLNYRTHSDLYSNLSDTSAKRYNYFKHIKSDIKYYHSNFVYMVTFFCLRLNSPTRARAASFSRFLDHIQWHTAVGRTPLHEWSARRRGLYMTPHITHDRQTRNRNPASDGPQTFALQSSAVEMVQRRSLHNPRRVWPLINAKTLTLRSLENRKKHVVKSSILFTPTKTYKKSTVTVLIVNLGNNFTLRPPYPR